MAIISSRPQPANSEDPPPAKVGKKASSSPIQTPKTDPSLPNRELLPKAAIGEETQEAKIRPQRLVDYIGQKDLKGVLQISIAAAQGRKDPLDHLLLYGPPGLGKTTMALILAAEMGTNCQITSAPALERPRDIVGLLMKITAGDILFIDEIHRLSRMTEELLYPAMEDFRLDITIGKGQSAKIRSLPLPPFTLIGATTRVGALSSPLRDRFGLIQRLKFYELDELTTIIHRTAGILPVNITPEGAMEVARRARGTPRIANRLLKRVRDYTQVQQAPQITKELAAAALELLEVDPLGLDWLDRSLLKIIIEHFNSGPVGLESLAAALGEDIKTIEEVCEPYLLQIGYLQRTPRGRVATEAARKHLGY